MRKNWKKVLSLVLALAMVLNMNVAAFADEAVPVADPAIEEEAPAAEPAPAAEEPAAEEEPAEAEAPAEEAAEAPAAAEPEAAAPVEAEAEKEDAAEGNESAPGTIYKDGDTVSGVKVYFEKRGSVISENNGKTLKIQSGALVALNGGFPAHDSALSDNVMTVELGDGAEVYIGKKFTGAATFVDNRDNRYIGNGDDSYLRNVKFTGNGTVYIEQNYDNTENNIFLDSNVRVVVYQNGITSTASYTRPNTNFLLSANKIVPFISTDASFSEVFTGFTGKLQYFNLLQSNPPSDPADDKDAFAKSISRCDATISTNKGISIFNGTAFGPVAASVNTVTVGEGKDYNFGDYAYFFNPDGPTYHYYRIPTKNVAPDVTNVKIADGKLFEGAWRYDGIDISEILNGAINGNYRYVLATGSDVPKASVSGWAPYAAAHDTFKKVADNTDAKPDTEYTLYAMNINPAGNRFYSDVVAVGSFKTKTIPTKLTITAPSESYYIGDANDDWLKANGTAFTNMTFAFEGNETDERKKLNVDLSNTFNNGNYKARNYNSTSKSIETDVIMSDVVVGKIYTYVVLSGNGAVSAADVDKMSKDALKDASASTLGAMRTLNDGGSSTDIKSLSANRYFVRSFFEAFDTTDYNGQLNVGLGVEKIDLPYKTASSNTVELVIKPAPVVAVPDVKANVADGTYVKVNGSTKGQYDNKWLAYNENTTYGVVSGDQVGLSVYAYNVKTGDPMSYWDEGYFNDKYHYYDGEFDTNLTGTVTLNNKVIGTSTVPVSTNDAGVIAISAGSLKFTNDYVSQNYIIDEGTYLNKEWKLEVEASAAAGTYEFGDWAGTVQYGAPLDYVKYVAGNHTHKLNGQPVASDDEDIEDYSDKTYINGDSADWVVLNEDKVTVISTDAAMAEIPAGKTVYVSADSISVNGKTITASENNLVPVKVEKRGIRVYAHAYMDRGDDIPKTISAGGVYGDILTETYHNRFDDSDYPAYNFATKKGNFQGEALLQGGTVSIKASDMIDNMKTGRQLIDLDPITLSSLLSDNYYVYSHIGYLTINKKYHIYYILGYNGEKTIATQVVKNDFTIRPYTFLNALPKAEKDKWAKVLKTTANGKLTGVLNDADGDILTGWRFSKSLYGTMHYYDGAWNTDDWNYSQLGYNMWDINKPEGFSENADYFDVDIDSINDDLYVTAVVTAFPRGDVQIESIAPVWYNGLAHVQSSGDNYALKNLPKNQVNDLGLVVKDRSGGYLTNGKDYKVTYKNNTNASVYFVNGGKSTTLGDEVKQLYPDKKKWPQAVITGTGKYKGWKATIYFDIYPLNINNTGSLEADNYINDYTDYYNLEREIVGIKDTYLAATGKPAKVTFNIKKLKYAPVVTFNQDYGNKNASAWYDRHSQCVDDISKFSVLTLREKKDYNVQYSKQGEYDSKTDETLWYGVDKKGLVADYKDGNSRTNYRITITGTGNYTGSLSRTFSVVDKSSAEEFKKLSIKSPKATYQWLKLITLEEKPVGLKDLGISVSTKKVKSTPAKALVPGANDDNYRVVVYRVDKKGRYFEWIGSIDGEDEKLNIVDAGRYKVVIRPAAGNDYLEAGGKYYYGNVEKFFTIKGITLKEKDFNGFKKNLTQNDSKPYAQNVVLKNTAYSQYSKYLKSTGNYVDPLPYYNNSGKYYESYLRDWTYGGKTTQQYVNALNGNGYTAFNPSTGDVSFTDDGAGWVLGDQIDVYRYKVDYKIRNNDVGNYRLTVQPRGIFGRDPLHITYKRTGTANKILTIKNAK